MQTDLHVAIPGTIVSYDSTALTATIDLAMRKTIRASDDADGDAHVDLPRLQDVPIAFPSAQGFAIHFPLTAGDSVLCMICDSDFEGWWRGGELANPSSPARHTLAGAFAIPVSRSIAHASGSNLTIGKSPALATFSPSTVEVGGTNPIAKSDALSAIFDALTSAAVASGDGGTTFKANILAALEIDPRWINRATIVLKGG